ncbi:MAG TPA: addiction module protein [Pirellulales bacterium]|nr:addiction module protein [Pirellulales bacterium]
MTDFSRPVVIGELSVAERIILVQDLWDSIEADTNSVYTPTPELRAELDRRLAAHRANPTEGFTWEEVKAMCREQR